MPARRDSLATQDESSPASGGRGRNREGKEKEVFACTACGQVYSRMEYLKRHQRKHQDDRPFQCRDCSKAFARSDVLLRHRRRCHPSPPPNGSGPTNSPPPVHRTYPGMPVSSSRMDAREASPSRRKHARPSSASSQDGMPSQRRRLDDDEEDDEDQYGESSFRNGMGNGGVYGVGDGYNNAESSTYTPHLLPMFQQQANGSYSLNDMSDTNHLEDASVLLSMAYPGGVPNGENGMTVGGQRVVPDWEVGQSLAMMMEATANEENTSHRTTSVSSNGPEPKAADNQAALPEMNGSFLGTMSWLNSGANAGSAASTDKGSSSEGSNGWALTPTTPGRSNSPFPLASPFSPGNFTSSLPTHEASPEDEEANNNAAIMSILNQLAMYNTPQQFNNFNPERPIMRIDNIARNERQGPELLDKHSPFFLDSDRFSGCYNVPHWNMPPVRTLSLIASRTFHTVLNHFSMIHLPTFKLTDTAACLAFAICTVGGVKTNPGALDYHVAEGRFGPKPPKADDIDGPVPPGRTWESIYRQNYQNDGDKEAQKVNKWETSVVVRNEKTNMLVKSFALAKGVLMTEYNVALLQALILYHAPYFLSQDEKERQMANMFLGTIISISRQIGFFNTELEHYVPEINVPQDPYTPNELNLAWRRWIQLETRRRTIYLIYHLDTVSALEASIPCVLQSCEMAEIPLPAPDTLWNAADAEEWYAAVQKYRPMTLDEAMRRVFFLPTYGAFDTMHERADTKYYNLLNENEFGPFARVAMILTLLRGVMDIGEGRRDRGDWRDLTDLWINCSWLKPGKKMLGSDGKDLGQVTRSSLKSRFGMALEKWRQGWDFDSLCLNGVGESAKPTTPLSMSSGGSPPANTPQRVNYCEEGLPFYWLAVALLSILNSSPPASSDYNVFKELRYGDMLKTARRFTRLGEGACGPDGCPELTGIVHTTAPTATGTVPGVNAAGITADVIESALNGFQGFDADFGDLDLSLLGDLSGVGGDGGAMTVDSTGTTDSTGSGGGPQGMANAPGRGVHMTGLGDIDLGDFVGSY